MHSVPQTELKTHAHTHTPHMHTSTNVDKIARTPLNYMSEEEVTDNPQKPEAPKKEKQHFSVPSDQSK